MVKNYKEPPDRPFEEIPVSFIIDDESLDQGLNKRQFREEDSVHYESKNDKLYRQKRNKQKQKIVKIIIERLHKSQEREIFKLYFIERKFPCEISEILKLNRSRVRKKVEILKRKLPRIYQTYQLFRDLKKELKEVLPIKQYQKFKLYYDGWAACRQLVKKLNLETSHLELGENKLKNKLKKESWEKYLKLKRIRFNR